MNEKITPAPPASVPAQSGGLPPGFHDMVDELKTIVRGAHVRAQLKVNTELLRMYWEIGHTILKRRGEAKWGAKVVDGIAAALRAEFPSQRGFSRTNLKYMQHFARTWPEQIGQQAAGQLPWGHIQVLLDKCKTRPEQDFYAHRAVQHGWSRAMLEHWIRQGLHLTEGAALNNFAATAPEGSEVLQELVKDPYCLDFTRLSNGVPERDLEDALVAHIVEFLTQLGIGFAFVGRQFPLRVGESEFRLDLLFYHLKLRRYIVMELKTVKATPEHFGKLNFYLAVADDLVRDKEHDNPTIGILVAAARDRAVVEYALERAGSPMAVATWTGVDAEMQKMLPPAEDLARVADGVLHGTGTSGG
jgi:predicted nuclease of restriction endonuclease-like (RecB) superfamily